MGISKVIYAGETLIDLTADTVTADSLLTGKKAHGKDGELIVGSCTFDADTSDANATDTEILKDKTAYVNGTKVTGTMPNWGGANQMINDITQPNKILRGYHDGSGSVILDAGNTARLIPENIKNGVNILGVVGTMTGKEDVTVQTKTVTPTNEAQEVVPDSGYDYLASVTVAAIPYTTTENSAGGTTVAIG